MLQDNNCKQDSYNYKKETVHNAVQNIVLLLNKLYSEQILHSI